MYTTSSSVSPPPFAEFLNATRTSWTLDLRPGPVTFAVDYRVDYMCVPSRPTSSVAVHSP